MKNVVILVPSDNVNLSSISGTHEILTRANDYWCRQGNKSLIEVHVAGFTNQLSLSTGIFSIRPEDIHQLKKVDLIIIPSLSHDYDNILNNNGEMVDWIKSKYEGGAEVASICTGAFMLAATGLLDGRSCSTHWNAINAFRERFPGINVQTDILTTSRSGIYTNGGAYSFLNLLVFLIERYFDRQTAIYASKVFQIDIERTSQSTFLIFQTQKNHGDDVIVKAQTYIEQNLSGKISFENLASELAVSRRNFDRRFVKATGNTPVEYLQRVKVEAAKRILENSRMTVSEVMNDVGYSDDKAFREVFRKFTGLSPIEYRSRYNREFLAA